MKHSALKDMASLGLINQGDLDYTKTGEAKGLKPGHHVQGWQLAQSDPNEWVKQYLLPALTRTGVTDKDAILARISTLFQNQTVGQLVGLLATQQSRIEKDLALLRGAKDLPCSAGQPQCCRFLDAARCTLDIYIGTGGRPQQTGAAR
jgi:hypothetical protein